MADVRVFPFDTRTPAFARRPCLSSVKIKSQLYGVIKRHLLQNPGSKMVSMVKSSRRPTSIRNATYHFAVSGMR